MRRLAREVKVAPANFYNHYGNLDDLLLEIAADSFQAFRSQIAHISRTSTNRTEAWKRIVFHVVNFARHNPQLYRLMSGHVQDAWACPRYRLAAGAAFEDLMALIYGYRVFAMTDDFGPDDMKTLGDRVQLGYGLYAMLCGLSNMLALNGGIKSFALADTSQDSLAAFLNSILDAFLKGRLPEGAGNTA